MSPRAGSVAAPRIAIVLIWLVAILWCFPLLYMLLTSFKGEADVLPPSLWIAHPTLENYATVLRQEIVRYILDSAVITVSSVCMLPGARGARCLRRRVRQPRSTPRTCSSGSCRRRSSRRWPSSFPSFSCSD